MGTGKVEPFGHTAEGVEIQEITLANAGGTEAKILTWGAVVRDLVVPAKAGRQRVVLGLNSVNAYEAFSPHFGAVPGRFANRIAGGQFTLDGKTYQLPRNENNSTTLHGGPRGFGLLPWKLKDHSATSVTLTLHSPDGDSGFPGALDVTCVYTLLEPATLRFELTATTDAPTVVNLTNHSYFNLDGSPDILDHEVMIPAEKRTPTDANSIPTGELVSVAGTVWDFRKPRTIRNSSGQLYDGNFVLGDGPTSGRLIHAATVRSPKSGVMLEVHTDQPGVQLYDAQYLNCPVPGLDGVPYKRFGGFCLETQLFPDAPNQPHFPSSVLRPGERYSHATEFRFG